MTSISPPEHPTRMQAISWTIYKRLLHATGRPEEPPCTPCRKVNDFMVKITNHQSGG